MLLLPAEPALPYIRNTTHDDHFAPFLLDGQDRSISQLLAAWSSRVPDSFGASAFAQSGSSPRTGAESNVGWPRDPLNHIRIRGKANNGKMSVFEGIRASVPDFCDLDDIGKPIPLRLSRGVRPPAIVVNIRLDEDGLVWVFLFAPDAEWPPDERTPEKQNDTLVYFLRMDGDEISVVGKARFDTLIRPMGDMWAYDLVDLPSGDRKVRVGKLSLVQ